MDIEKYKKKLSEYILMKCIKIYEKSDRYITIIDINGETISLPNIKIEAIITSNTKNNIITLLQQNANNEMVDIENLYNDMGYYEHIDELDDTVENTFKEIKKNICDQLIAKILVEHDVPYFIPVVFETHSEKENIILYGITLLFPDANLSCNNIISCIFEGNDDDKNRMIKKLKEYVSN